MNSSTTARLCDSISKQRERLAGIIHTSQAAAAAAAAGAHRRQGRSREADTTLHPASLRKGSQQKRRAEKRREDRRRREVREGGERGGRRSKWTGQGEGDWGPVGEGMGGAGTGTTTTLRAQVAELAPTNPSARHAPTRPPHQIFLPRGSGGFPSSLRRLQAEAPRDWGKFSRSFRRRS